MGKFKISRQIAAPDLFCFEENSCIVLGAANLTQVPTDTYLPSTNLKRLLLHSPPLLFNSSLLTTSLQRVGVNTTFILSGQNILASVPNLNFLSLLLVSVTSYINFLPLLIISASSIPCFHLYSLIRHLSAFSVCLLL